MKLATEPKTGGGTIDICLSPEEHHKLIEDLEIEAARTSSDPGSPTSVELAAAFFKLMERPDFFHYYSIPLDRVVRL